MLNFQFFLFVSALLVRALKALGNSMFSVTFFDHLLRFFSIHFSRTFQFTRNLKSVAGLFPWAVHAFVHHVQMNAADDDFLWNLNSCLRIKLCYRKIAVGLNRIHTSSPLASQCNCGSKMPIDMFLCIFERSKKTSAKLCRYRSWIERHQLHHQQQQQHRKADICRNVHKWESVAGTTIKYHIITFLRWFSYNWQFIPLWLQFFFFSRLFSAFAFPLMRVACYLATYTKAQNFMEKNKL